DPRRDTAEGGRRRLVAGGPGRRHPARARLRELRPVQELRGARRRLPPARRGARVVKRSAGQLEFGVLVLVTLGLVAFGLVIVYSASSGEATVNADDPAYYLKRQAIYALVGLV